MNAFRLQCLVHLTDGYLSLFPFANDLENRFYETMNLTDETYDDSDDVCDGSGLEILN